jgi:hypothetical protein
LRERLDEGCAQAALCRNGDDIRLSDPIVGHDKLLVRSVDLVADDFGRGRTISFITATGTARAHTILAGLSR